MPDIPETQDGDIGAKDIPSWRRICKVYLIMTTGAGRCRFSPNKPKHYQRYSERVKAKRKEWGILCDKE
jgi:predicted phosphoadenosine phosphosulfate sulfurtransferase